MQETRRRRCWSLGWEDPRRRRCQPSLAWRISWAEEPGGLQSTRSHRVRRGWAHSQPSSASLQYNFWRRHPSRLPPLHWTELQSGAGGETLCRHGSYWTSQTSHVGSGGWGGVGQRGVGAGRDPLMERSPKDKVKRRDSGHSGHSGHWNREAEARWPSAGGKPGLHLRSLGEWKTLKACALKAMVFFLSSYFLRLMAFPPPRRKKQILKKKKINQLMNEFSFVIRC